MARARNIKPSFFMNDQLADCDPLARLLFAGLWTIADREGRLEDNARKIKAQTLPYDNCDCDKLLNQLVSGGFIYRYKVENNNYIQIVTFKEHQNPHVKESASSIPAPDKHHTSTVQNVPLPLNPIPYTESPIPQPKKIVAALPDWLPLDDWNDFLEIKRKLEKGAVATERQKKLLIGTLEKLQHQGHDPGKVLQQSIERGWKGLFELKGDYNAKTTGFTTNQESKDADFIKSRDRVLALTEFMLADKKG